MSFLGIGATRRLVSISKAAANGGLMFVIGEARVKAVSVFKKISGAYGASHSTAGRDFYYLSNTQDQENKGAKEFLYRIDVFAQGPISSYKRFYIDNDLHNSHRYTQRAYVQIFGFHGESGQTAFTWDSGIGAARGVNHKGVDVAYCVNRFYAHGKYPKFQGEPPVEAVLEGYPLFDPREVGHTAGDISTYAYCENPALGLLTYLTESVGANWTFSDLDLDSFEVAADFCDSIVSSPTLQTNDTGSPLVYWDVEEGLWLSVATGDPIPYQSDNATAGNQKRMVASLQLNPEDTVKDNIEKALNVMGGHLPFSNGKYKLIIEDEALSTVMSFDDDSVLGNWKIKSAGRKDRMNRATVTFLNKNKAYKEDSVSWPKLDSAQYTTYLAEDSAQALHQTFDITGVPDFHQASAWAEYKVRNSRASRAVTVDLAPKAMLLEYGDVIDITSTSRGWTAKWFRVRKNTLKTDGTCTVDLVEYDGTIYPWSTKEDEPLDALLDTPSPWEDPIAVTGLAATVFHQAKDDGTYISGFNVSWDAPTDTNGLDSIEIAWKLSTDSDYNNASRVLPENTTAKLIGLADNANHDIRVTYRTSLGQISAVAELLDHALTISPSTTSYKYNSILGLFADPDFRKTNAIASGLGSFWSDSTAASIVAGEGVGAGPVLRCTADGATGTITKVIAPDEYFNVQSGDILEIAIRARQSATGDATGSDWRAEFHQRDALAASKGWINIIDADDLPADGNWYSFIQRIVITTADVVEAAFHLTDDVGFTTGYIDVDYYGVQIIPQRSDNAAISFPNLTLVPEANTTVRGNTIEKTSGAAAWNTGAYSTEGLLGSAQMSVVVPATTYSVMAGLNSDPATSWNFSDIDYAIYATNIGTIYIYESGVSKGSFGTYNAGSILETTWDGLSINYYVDGVWRYASLAPPVNTARMYFDSSLHTVGASLTNIAFSSGSSALADIYGSAANLLGSDAGPVHDSRYYYYTLSAISDLNLVIGGRINGSVLWTSTDATAAGLRIQVIFYNISSVFISSVQGNNLSGTMTDVESKFENVEIPATTVYMSILAYDTAGDTTLMTARNAMLNRGPVAVPYTDRVIEGQGVMATAQNMPSSFNMDQGGGVLRTIPRGIITGTAFDGSALTFDRAYANAPLVIFLTGGKTSHSSLTGDQYQVFTCSALTASGFTPSLLLKETVGTITEVNTTNAAVVGPTYDYELNNDSGTAIAWDDSYDYQIDLSIDTIGDFDPIEKIWNYDAGWVDVNFYVWTGVWTQAGGTSRIYGVGGSSSPDTVLNKILTKVGAGLVARTGGEFAVDVIASANGGSITSFDKVTFGGATAPAEAVATVDTAGVNFMVIEGEE